MYKHSNRLACLAAGVALAVAACGDDPTGTNSGDQLTAVEVQALFTALGSSLWNKPRCITDFSSASKSRPAASQWRLNTSIL